MPQFQAVCWMRCNGPAACAYKTFLYARFRRLIPERLVTRAGNKRQGVGKCALGAIGSCMWGNVQCVCAWTLGGQAGRRAGRQEGESTSVDRTKIYHSPDRSPIRSDRRLCCPSRSLRGYYDPKAGMLVSVALAEAFAGPFETRHFRWLCRAWF